MLFDLTDHSVAFKVTAKGAWKITIKPTEAAKAWDGTKAIKGKGDALIATSVADDGGDEGGREGDRQGPFAVRAHTATRRSTSSTSAGPYKGTVTLPEDTTCSRSAPRAPGRSRPPAERACR